MPDERHIQDDALAGGAEQEQRGVLVALVTRDRRLALTLGPSRPWEGALGVRLAPLAFPAADATPGDGREAALALGARMLGYDLEPAPTPWTYGPSARRAIDRAPASAPGAPFLRYTRYDARGEEPAGGAPLPPPIPVQVDVYLARAIGAVHLVERAASDAVTIWAPFSALRAAVGGLWLGALLALEGVSVDRSTEDLARFGSPDETLVFTPAIAGERQLLRACAKYGDDILFPES